MTRLELVEKIYDLKKDHLPNMVGSDRPISKALFFKRYLRAFSKTDLEGLLLRELHLA